MVKSINTKINKKNHEKLKNFSDGSMDKNLNLLMDTVNDHMPFVDYDEKMVSVSLYTDTLERLDGFHITASEGRDNILTRLFLKYEELNGVQPIEIPFKLTSPLNKELYIIGVCTPQKISYDSENDSLEYKAWLKLLDWDEIQKLILNHSDERISFNRPIYRLDINNIESSN